MSKRLILAGLASLLVACGEDTPVEKCDHLVDITCDRAVQCIPNGGTHSECVQAVQTALPCGSAVSVTASYDRCVNQLDTVGCAILFPNGQLDLPADCDGVILTSRLASDDGTHSTSALTHGSLEFVDEQN